MDPQAGGKDASLLNLLTAPVEDIEADLITFLEADLVCLRFERIAAKCCCQDAEKEDDYSAAHSRDTLYSSVLLYDASPCWN